MKKKNTVLLLGIFAILILIAAQVIIIRGVWKQQDQTLRFRYRELSQQAIRESNNAFDTVYFLLGKHSDDLVKKLDGITDSLKMKEKKDEIFDYFLKVLNKEQDLSPYLLSFFKRIGFETSFIPRIEISNLEIIGKNTYTIYQNDFFRNQKPPDLSSQRPGKLNSSSSILVSRYWNGTDHYNLNFDYYIDFSDKRKMILREISASLGMSLFSILAIVIMFIITYRNLMEEKRMSNLKTDFINNMTHELKTPLATITVAGKTLEMEKIRQDDSKILETAKLIGKQSIHLNQLINMILEISMWERTEFQLDKKKTNIEELMNDIVDSFRSGAGHYASLSQKYSLNDVKADIDVVYFTTMINNLLSNSVKYCDKEPIIHVEGFIEDKNICIRITDNGIGISKTDQKHIFDKFYRASTGNIHKYKGLGLGLYYVKTIALAHGGNVTVDSKPGKGSIFTLTIPY
jgi:two-component system, OmpR family, phosphate regulon sensor histidine kinase PhoR